MDHLGLVEAVDGLGQGIIIGISDTAHGRFDPRFGEVFGSERLTGALLDRLTHHVHILEMNGESYRLNQSRKRQKSPKTPVCTPGHG